MCNFNNLCQNREGTCICNRKNGHPEVIQPIPVPFVSSNGFSLIPALFKMILQQNEAIKCVADQVKQALGLINSIAEANQEKSFLGESENSEQAISSRRLEAFICGNEIKHTHFLQIVSDLPNPAYKERAFSLLLHIIDSSEKIVNLADSVTFKIMLFTTENPPKLIKINTSGDNILKGTIETQGTCNIMFRKIAIKEVTSHFRGGCFFFVVAPVDANYIKPLIIENFVVKARKISTEKDCPRKKIKLQEEVF